MTTVKEFKDLDGVPVFGDMCKDLISGIAYGAVKGCDGWVERVGRGENQFNDDEIISFAWRPINTLPDNPKFKYEANETSWRPKLDQSAVKPSDDKPVFTQAMADAAYELSLHKANSELLASLTDFMVKNNIGKIGESCIDVAIRELSEKHGIDTRTPKQKAVEELALCILSAPLTIDGIGLAKFLYDAGYEKC